MPAFSGNQFDDCALIKYYTLEPIIEKTFNKF